MNDFDWKSNLLSDLDYAWQMSESTLQDFLVELFELLKLFVASRKI